MLKGRGVERTTVHVSVSVAGEGVHEVDVAEGTYGDLLDAVGLSPQAAAVLVDGRPVPEDGAIEADHVEVVRLISGG